MVFTLLGFLKLSLFAILEQYIIEQQWFAMPVQTIAQFVATQLIVLLAI